MSRDSAIAFAPATVANVAVGFDVLGFALDGIGDEVRVTRLEAERGCVRILPCEGAPDLPLDPARNTAGAALLALIEAVDPAFGFEVRIRKGVVPGSGLGSSASSAVGAVVAAEALLNTALDPMLRFELALAGEAVASGVLHGDNVAPCMYGGLTAVLPGPPMEVVRLPIPTGLRCAIVRPELALETRAQRALLPESIPLALHVTQSAHLAGFIAACYTDDLRLLRASLRDLIVGPARSVSIRGFAAARAAALEAGALCCELSGSGPALFALVGPQASDAKVRTALVDAFREHGLRADSWATELATRGAHCIEPTP